MKDKYENRQERYRPIVADELSAIGELMENAAQELRPLQLDQQSTGRLTRMDAMQQHAMAEEAQRRRKLRQLQLKQTLKRMDEDEYGYCADCGDEIPDGRLDIDPTFHLCVKCAK
jgi:DnaK suppressor protein